MMRVSEIIDEWWGVSLKKTAKETESHTHGDKQINK